MKCVCSSVSGPPRNAFIIINVMSSYVFMNVLWNLSLNKHVHIIFSSFLLIITITHHNIVECIEQRRCLFFFVNVIVMRNEISSHFTSSYTLNGVRIGRSTVTLIRTQHILSAPFVCGVRSGQWIYQINMRVCTSIQASSSQPFKHTCHELSMIWSANYCLKPQQVFVLFHKKFNDEFYRYCIFSRLNFCYGIFVRYPISVRSLNPIFFFFNKHKCFHQEEPFKKYNVLYSINWFAFFDFIWAKRSNHFSVVFFSTLFSKSHSLRFVIMTHLVFLVLLCSFFVIQMRRG